MRRPAALGSIFLLLLAASALPSAATLGAPQIGVTSAVVPAARGTPTDGSARVLQVGLDMQANERVQTDADGKAHLLFLDGSALSIGPNSDVVLDEYVYDPRTQSGKIALSATRGLFRLVGGKISKTTPVTLRTPSATIGVRGGIATMSVGRTVSANFLFGEEMFVEGGGQRQRATRPGFSIVTDASGAPQPPTPLTQESVDRQNAAFEGGGGEPSPGAPAVSDEDVAQSQVSALNSTVAALDAAPAAGGEAPPPPAPPTDETTDASQGEMRDQALQDGGDDDGVTPPPPNGGAAAPPSPTPTPTPGGGLTLSGTFVGRAKLEHPDGPGTGTHDESLSQNLRLENGSVADGVFSASGLSMGEYFFTANVEAGGFTAATTQQPFGTGVLMGGAFLAATQDFLVYNLVDQSNGRRVFAFAGVPTPTAQLPDDIWRYVLLNDFVRGQTLPFIDDPSGGMVGATEAFITWDGGPGAYKFGAGTVAIVGQGSGQQSAFSALFGDVLSDGSGRPHIVGRMLGQVRDGSDADADRLAFFRSPVATSDAADGSDFFGQGGPRYFVLEAAQMDSGDGIISRGGERFVSDDASTSAYFPNNTAVASGQVGDTRSTRTLNGFANALELRFDPSGNFISGQKLGNADPGGVTISTDVNTRNVAALFTLFAASDEASVEIAFGDESSNSAFIDDGRFVALNEGVVSVDQTPVDGDLALITSHALQSNGFLPDGVSFCNCEYLVWGFFAGRREGGDGGERHVELGTWVTGLMADLQSQMPASQMSASYTGHVIAGVNNAGALYQAAGAISLAFTFAVGGQNTFQLDGVTITNFDGMTITGAPNTDLGNTNYYDTTLSGPGLTGTLRGALFGPGTPPENAGGTVDLVGTSYSAYGTFAATRP